MIEIGIDSFAATIPDPATGNTLPAADRMEKLLAEVETADQVRLDVFGIGEHHRKGIPRCGAAGDPRGRCCSHDAHSSY